MTEEKARERARSAGVTFVRNLQRRFAGRRMWGGVEVREHSDGIWFIQWSNGRIVGGGLGVDGERVMVAGGPVIGSKVSAAPIYEAMDACGLKPSKKLTPYGRDAQIRWALTAQSDMRYRVNKVLRPSGPAPRRVNSKSGV